MGPNEEKEAPEEEGLEASSRISVSRIAMEEPAAQAERHDSLKTGALCRRPFLVRNGPPRQNLLKYFFKNVHVDQADSVLRCGAASGLLLRPTAFLWCNRRACSPDGGRKDPS